MDVNLPLKALVNHPTSLQFTGGDATNRALNDLLASTLHFCLS